MRSATALNQTTIQTKLSGFVTGNPMGDSPLSEGFVSRLDNILPSYKDVCRYRRLPSLPLLLILPVILKDINIWIIIGLMVVNRYIRKKNERECIR